MNPTEKKKSILKDFFYQNTITLDEIDLDNLINSILADLTLQERKIIEARFGLVGEPQTLAKIGKKMNLTRERIRQIVNHTLNKIRERHLNKEIKPFLQFITHFIENKGGLISKEEVVKFFKEKQINQNNITFLFQLIPDIKEISETKSLKSFYILKNLSLSMVEQLLDNAISILENEKKLLDKETFLSKIKDSDFYKQYETQIPGDEFIWTVLKISKKIAFLNENQIGLNKWSFVKPKNAADKAYLILKKFHTPLHFAELTEKINKEFPEKEINQDTVHNELIEDQRFVLIGRGIYALAEWGYTPGTVSDVIEKIFRETKKPLSIKEITEKVLKERIVKKNTIIINLQNRNKFKRVKKGVYTLADQPLINQGNELN